MKILDNKTILMAYSTLAFLTACGGSSGGTSSSSVDTTAPVFESNASVVIRENSRGAFTLFASDVNDVTYVISNRDSTSFSINENTGKVSFNEVPNYERKNSYVFTAIATDSFANFSTQEVRVTIVDVEESVGKFIMTVNTSTTGSAGESSAVEFVVPTNTVSFPDGYNYSVDCDNDGLNEATEVRGNYTCEYASEGTYSIAIEGDFPQIYFNQEGDKNKLTSIDQWGNIEWKAMNKSFRGCINLAGQAVDSPNLSAVTSMDTMFNGASSFEQNISNWDVSNVIYMDGMFSGATVFNQDIGSWDVSNVQSMSSMFAGASTFNQDLSRWNVLSVGSMRFMFANARAFDQNIGVWQPYAATHMDGMFNGVTLSIANYRLLLEGWDFKKINLQNNVIFSGGNSVIGCTGIEDTSCLPAQVARQALKNDKGWIITDGDS